MMLPHSMVPSGPRCDSLRRHTGPLHQASRRIACMVRAAVPGKEAQRLVKQKYPAMPTLPERKQQRSPSPTKQAPRADNDKHHGTSSSSSSRRSPALTPPQRGSRGSRLLQPQPTPPEDEQQQQSAQERTVAGMLAYAGLMGTVATAVSFMCPGVDLFGNFHLAQPDIILGLQLLLPCCVLNLAIMAPEYSSWQVPPEPTLEAQQQMAEALLAYSAKQKAAAASATGDAGAGDQGGASTSSPGSSSDASSSSSSNAGDQAPRQTDTASSSGTIGSSRARPAVLAAGGPAFPPPMGLLPPFGTPTEPPLPPGIARLKDAMLMAQGHYLSATPGAGLPWYTQGGMLLLNCLAAELLYHSVTLQVAGGWLSDRIPEAGVEDLFVALSASLPVLPTPHMTGQLAAVAMLSAAWVVAVAQKVLRMSHRPTLVMESQGRVAASKLLADIKKASAARHRQEQKQGQAGVQEDIQQQQQQQELPSRGASFAAPDDIMPSTSSTQPGAAADAESEQPPKSASRAAADLATAAAAGTTSAEHSSSSSSARRRAGKAAAGVVIAAGQQPEQAAWRSVLPNTLNALALSQVVTGVRDLSQAAGLGLAFALTGNLAAPFVAAVASEALMAVLQWRGQQRARQRSIAFAKRMASFSRVFRDVQRKQQMADTTAAAAAPAAATVPGAEGAPASSGSLQSQNTPGSEQLAATTAAAASPASASSDNGSPALQQLVADAAALDAQLAAAHVMPSQGAAAASVLDSPVAEAAVPAAGQGGATRGASSRMEQTIAVLDQLLGEQLPDHAAAAGSHTK